MSDQFKNEIDRMSYAMGMNMGEYLTRTPLEINLDAAREGIADFINKAPKLSQEEYVAMMQLLQQKMQEVADLRAKIEEAKTTLQSRQVEVRAKRTFVCVCIICSDSHC